MHPGQDLQGPRLPRHRERDELARKAIGRQDQRCPRASQVIEPCTNIRRLFQRTLTKWVGFVQLTLLLKLVCFVKKQIVCTISKTLI